MDEDIKLGSEARQVLDAVVYQNARNALRTQIIADWLASDPRDVEAREMLYCMAIGLQAVQSQLEALVRGETLARAQRDIEGKGNGGTNRSKKRP